MEPESDFTQIAWKALTFMAAAFVGFAGLVVRGIAGYGGWVIIFVPASVLLVPWALYKRNCGAAAAFTSLSLGAVFGYGYKHDNVTLQIGSAAVQALIMAIYWWAEFGRRNNSGHEADLGRE